MGTGRDTERALKAMIEVDEALLARAESAAAREQTTLARLDEEGLRLRLGDTAEAPPTIALAVYHGRRGLTPAVVEPLKNHSLFDAADGTAAVLRRT